MKTIKTLKTTLSALAVAAGLFASAGANASYTITEIKNFPGGTSNVPESINKYDQVSGIAWTTSGNTGFFWQQGTMTNIGTAYSGGSVAYGINDSGQVVFDYQDAMIWKNGTLTDLGTLGGSSSSGRGINNNGQVVGYAYNASGAQHAFIDQNGVMTDLGTLGGTSSQAFGINNNGQVVGEAYTTSNAQHAFIDQNGVMTDLGTLGGTGSLAYGINNNGQVVGYANNASGAQHAFIDQNGTMTDLGTLGGANSFAIAINDNRQVVGWADNAAGAQRAFIDQNGVMTDLNSLLPTGSGWVLQNATAININGDIVGNGTLNGVSTAFLLSASTLSTTSTVPEPGSIALLALGTTGLIGVRRKSKTRD
jgi:probable HAF family extracellular repeat protein